MSGTHLVAILNLSGPLDAAVAPLAADLGTAAYDLRLALAGGFPAVVVLSPDPTLAAKSASAIRARGHRVAILDRTNVTPSSRMLELRDFSLEASGVRANGAGPDRLAFGDISALLRATHRTTTVTTQEVKERKLRPGMAIVTGGLVLSKTTTKEVTSKTEERQQVLYLFRRSGEPPWILRERSARYAGLGAELRPVAHENFATTIRKLRELAPGAAYDERLVNTRPLRGIADGIEATDLLAYLIASDLTESP